MRKSQPVLISGLLTFLLVTVGCGDSKSVVSGMVTFDDKPVEKGAITFYPVDGKSTTFGGTIAGGKYVVRDALPGDVKVVITGTRYTGKTKKLYDTPTSPVVEETAELLPPKFSSLDRSELKFSIPAGTSEKNFELKSK